MTAVYYNDNEPFVCDWLENLIREKLLPDGLVDRRPRECDAADGAASQRWTRRWVSKMTGKIRVDGQPGCAWFSRREVRSTHRPVGMPVTPCSFRSS